MEHRLPRSASPGALIVALAFASGCTADQPALTDANKPLDGKCSGPYADQVLDYFPATLANPSNALGAPDGNAVPLTDNAVITVGFIGLGAVTDAGGPDIHIDASVAAGASALVRVAGVDQQFRYTGTLTPMVSDFDIGVAMLTSIVYVRVIDVSGSIQLDAFTAIHDHCR
jgi:hypothetical protein